MGTPKGLLEFEGLPWVVSQIRSLGGCGFAKIIVVLGFGAENYFSREPVLKKAINEWVRFDEGLAIKTLVNQNPELGQFSSLVTGFREVLSSTEERIGAFVLPVDVPCPMIKVWRQLYSEMDGNRQVKTCIPQYSNCCGHPVLLSSSFLRELSILPLDSSEARLDLQIGLLSKEERKNVTVNDPLVCFNINTPKDWEIFVEKYLCSKDARKALLIEESK